MQERKKRQIIFVNEIHRPSRFLLDLKGMEEAAVRNLAREKKQIFGALDTWISRKDGSGAGKKPEQPQKRSKDMNRLAFFLLFKLAYQAFAFVFKAFFRLNYRLGWLALYVARLFHLLFKKACTANLLHIFRKKQPEKSGRLSFLKKPCQHEDSLIEDAACALSAFLHQEKKPKGIARLWHAPKLRLRPLLSIISVMILISLPFKALVIYQDLLSLKDRVFGLSAAAVTDIRTGGTQALRKNWSEAGDDFSNAGRNFEAAQNELSQISALLDAFALVAPGEKAAMAGNAEKFLEAGRLSAGIASDISGILAVFNDSGASLEKILNSFYGYESRLQAQAASLAGLIGQIDEKALPQEYRPAFLEIQAKAELVSGGLDGFFKAMHSAKSIMGLDQEKRYLFVFQNNAELRGGGGFIGSYALVDVAGAEIKSVEVPAGGSYETKGGLYELIASPEPLWLSSPRWYFWDANWWPDWPTSAGKLAWFYEKSGGPTVDGVIGFTPTVLENLLEALGPVDMREKYGVVLDASNVWQVLQVVSEQKWPGHPDYERYLKLYEETLGVKNLDFADVSSSTAATSTDQQASSTPKTVFKHEPKKIIGELMGELIARIRTGMDKKRFFALMNLVLDSLERKQIMLFFQDQDLQAQAQERGWTAGIKSAARDYLMVVNSNIAGQKTDKVISQEVRHKSEVATDGTITDTVEITRTHNGIKGDAFTGVRNVNWLRVYAPAGSRLVLASGFSLPDDFYFERPDPSWSDDPYVKATEGQGETDKNSGVKIYKEKNKTVFANWTQLNPGETKTVVLKYVLPFRLEPQELSGGLADRISGILSGDAVKRAPYSLLAQKQPGCQPFQFESRLVLPEGYSLVWQSFDRRPATDAWSVAETLDQDKFWAALVDLGRGAY